MRRRVKVLAPLLAAIALVSIAGAAQAGVYTVYACDAAGTRWDNRSWALTANVGGITADQDCPAAGSNIGLNQTPGARTAAGNHAALQFLAPAGTGIADFRLTKRLIFRNPAQDGTRPLLRDHGAGRHGDRGRGPLPRGTRDRSTPRAAGTAIRRATPTPAS